MFFRAILALFAVLLLSSPALGVCLETEKLLAGEKILYDVHISRYGKVGETRISIRIVDSINGLYLAEFVSKPYGLASVFSDVSRDVFTSKLKLEKGRLVSQGFYNETHYGSARFSKTEFSFEDQAKVFVKRKYDEGLMMYKKVLAAEKVSREDLLSVFYNLRHRLYGVLPDGLTLKIKTLPFALGDKSDSEESEIEIKVAVGEEMNLFRKVDERGDSSKYLLFFKVPQGLFKRGAISGRVWSNECLLPEFFLLKNATKIGDDLVIRLSAKK